MSISRQAMIDEFDLDQDGEISEAEFVSVALQSNNRDLIATLVFTD